MKLKLGCIALVSGVCLSMSVMAEQAVQNLPAPDKTGGKPLMQALAERKAIRDFSDKAIEPQTLSELLWATWGINRSDGHRTVPTAMNRQQIVVYVVKQDGVWRYEASNNSLVKVLDKDYRSEFGNAPLSFVYAGAQGEHNSLSIGALFQNAGLYSASAGLANVVRAQYMNVLADKLPLPEDYKIYITQSFGWPK